MKQRFDTPGPDDVNALRRRAAIYWVSGNKPLALAFAKRAGLTQKELIEEAGRSSDALSDEGSQTIKTTVP